MVSKITCSKCGEIKAVRPEVFDKRAEKFGSEKELIANYKCLKCRDSKSNKKKGKRKRGFIKNDKWKNFYMNGYKRE